MEHRDKLPWTTSMLSRSDLNTCLTSSLGEASSASWTVTYIRSRRPITPVHLFSQCAVLLAVAELVEHTLHRSPQFMGQTSRIGSE